MTQGIAHGLVHLIEEGTELRHRLTTLLRNFGHMTIVYEQAGPFLDILPTLSPGCVVASVAASQPDGLGLLRAVKASGRAMPVILLTDIGEVTLAVEAMKLGAADYLQLPVDPEALQAAVRRAIQDAEQLGSAQEFLVNLARLTPRERQVLNCVVQGESNKAVARRLEISPRTVEIYRANVMLKMHADNISELIRTAIRAGIL